MPSPVDTSVKFAASWMPGAPQLTNVNGQFITALDVMVNGGDQRAGTINVAAGLATLTFAGGSHMAIEDAVILVEDSGVPALEGEQRVLSATSDTITFPTNAADGGPYSCDFMLAPMGWEKVFSGTNKGVYRSTNIDFERMFLRVEQVSFQNATVRAFRNMTDVDTGTDPMPTSAELATPTWHIRTYNQTNPLPWFFLTDGVTMFIWTESALSISPSYGGGLCHMFGPPVKREEIIDPYNTMFTCSNSTSYVATGITRWGGPTGAQSRGYVSRAYTGVGNYQPLHMAVAATAASTWDGPGSQWGNYPDPVNGSLITSDIFLISGAAPSSAGSGVRGKVPGVKIGVQSLLAGQFSYGDKITIDGRKHIVLTQAVNGSQSPTQTTPTFFDIEGPWR